MACLVLKVWCGSRGVKQVAKLSVELPDTLEDILKQYIPWGSKGTIVTELLWQLADAAKADGGKTVYELIRASQDRETRTQSK